MDIMLKRILEIIGDKHGSSKELADFIGVKSSVITDWRGNRNKSYSKYAPKIAEFYGVSVDWISGLTDDKEQKNNPADIKM